MRYAVVGSGVAGLTAAHVLQRRGEVTLFEADDRLGGHAHTHEFGVDRVDSGFIVHNEETYPLLTRLFRELGVATQDTEMSMSVSCAGCGLEYAGARGPRGLFAQRRFGPRYLRMLGQVPRFHRRARELLEGDDDPTMRRFLAAERFSPYFIRHFATPMIAAVWSCAPDTALEYPARHLFAFLANHGMLSVSGSKQWKTVTGGSRGYVDLVAKGLTDVRTDTPVRAVVRDPGGVEIRDDADRAHRFDAVVIATHPDQALALLAAPTDDERATLGAFTYSRNTTVLHSDAAVLPAAPGARAAWNYRMDSCTTSADRARVTYDMNLLQRLTGPGRYLVTLGDSVAPEHVLARMDYEHPIFTPESVAAQRRLPGLSTGRSAFAGAYHGWGFHEDGCRSGVAAAAALGAPW